MPRNPSRRPALPCTFEIVGDHVLVQRFERNALFTLELLERLAVERDRLCGKHGRFLLVVIPEGIPVNAELTNIDHFLDQRVRQCIKGLAIVAEEGVMRSVCKFYFKWFPQPFRVRVFSRIAAAEQWIIDLVAAQV